MTQDTLTAPTQKIDSPTDSFSKEQRALFEEGYALKDDILRLLVSRGYSYKNAEEARHDTFIRFTDCVRLNKYKGDSRLFTYLSSIALNTAADLHRIKKRRAKNGVIDYFNDNSALERAAGQNKIQHETEDDIEFSKMMPEIQKAFWKAVEAKLSDTQYKVIFMDMVENMRGREIAETLGISEGNVRITKKRALDRMKNSNISEELYNLCAE